MFRTYNYIFIDFFISNWLWAEYDPKVEIIPKNVQADKIIK